MKHKYKKLFIFLICFFVALIIVEFVAYLLLRNEMSKVEITNNVGDTTEQTVSNSGLRISDIKIGDTKYNVEIAETNAERSLGLGNRKSLAQNSGMLFVFDKSGFYKFWMKDTLIPLDMIWLAKSEVDGIAKLKIVEIAENVLPESYPNQIGGNFKADYVIELNAGEVSKSNIKLGQEVLINN